MAWTSWATLLANWKTALADKDPDSFFHSGYENSREMRITYTQLGNVMAFTEWLEAKVAEESVGLSSGQIPSAIGGY